MTIEQLTLGEGLGHRITYLKKAIERGNFLYGMITDPLFERNERSIRNVEMLDAFIEPEFIETYIKNMTDRVAQLEKEFSEL